MAGGYIGTAPADRDPTVSDDSVTTAKIQDNAVTGTKIAMTSDAAGDILTYTGTDYARLAIGAAGRVLKVNSGATAVEWATDTAGTGDVVGPGSATNDALARFDTTTGKLIQNSTANLSDAGTLTATAFAGALTGNVTGNVTGNIDGIVGGTTPAAVSATQVDITAQGDLRLQDTSGGEYVALQAAGTTTSYTVTLPAAVATVTGQALTSTTAGVASWTTVGDAVLSAAQEWSASQNFNATTLTFNATQAWNAQTDQVTKVVVTANVTFSAPSNQKDGGFYAVTVEQDGTRGRTGSWITVFKWAGGTAPTLTTTASAKDIFVFRSDGMIMQEVGRQLNVS